LNLKISHSFIYGEESLPQDSSEVGPDAPDPGVLKAHGINIAVVPNAGHAQMFENLNGFVDALTQALA
jgi:hypothetical protein